ncbi:MAG: ABC transporter permease subunit [Planctomycetota bacterium]|jgi:putative spermidine/putrescine transport system permease protein|nr:ABC transporter permease subunit [Planctomycetota bacterium]
MTKKKWLWVSLLAFPGFATLLAFFVLPLGTVLVEPFLDRGDAFVRLIGDPLFWRGLKGSLTLAVTAGAASVLCGVPVAFSLARMPERLKAPVMFCISLPLTFSGLIVAYGFILSFGRAGFVTQLLARLGVPPEWVAEITYSPVGLAMAYCYYLIPRVVLLLLPVVSNFDRTLLTAANSLGAGRARAWFDIALPELFPTIVFSFFLVAAIAFSAYGTALALVGTQVNILPLLLYSRISDTGSDFPQAAAISLVLMFVCAAMMGIAELVAVRRERFKGNA